MLTKGSWLVTVCCIDGYDLHNPRILEKLFLLIGYTLVFSISLTAQAPSVEICDNALDDDGDGLIDLNDPDCDCPFQMLSSLIPNPSFEDQICCPSDRSQLSCAAEWEQASDPTTDYIHTCGWLGWDNLPVPQPFPDGDGVMGFRNGVPSFGDLPANPNWKEYAGACLNAPMLAGESYRFEFQVGFTQDNSPSTTLEFFGVGDCSLLPFGLGDPMIGCPTNVGFWSRLGSVPISGTFEWKPYEITVTPSEDIYAIAIGPNCSPVNGIQEETYYLFDELILAEQSAFEFSIQPVGNPCVAAFGLRVPFRDTLAYQWYLDGVALLGETSENLRDVDFREGIYQVRIVGPNSCQLLEVYEYQVPVLRNLRQATICAEDSYLFHGLSYNQTGTYYDTLATAENCDSIVQLDLNVRPTPLDTFVIAILPGESIQTSGRTFAAEGRYDLLLSNEFGCDSLVHLVIEHYQVYIPNAFSPNFDGVNDNFEVFTGPGVEAVTAFQVFDRWGSLVYNQDFTLASEQRQRIVAWSGEVGKIPAPSGVYIYKLLIRFNDGRERTFSGDVMLLR